MDHKEMAIACFNGTWDLMDKASRTEEENMEMIHQAHASVYHWSKLGKPLNLTRGEWQVSRVYGLLSMGESALYHGMKCLDYCEKNDFRDYDLAFAYESIARAHKVLGDETSYKAYYEKAMIACEAISDEDNKAYFEQELKSI